MAWRRRRWEKLEVGRLRRSNKALIDGGSNPASTERERERERDNRSRIVSCNTHTHTHTHTLKQPVDKGVCLCQSPQGPLPPPVGREETPKEGSL